MPDETATFEHFQIARREDGSLFELGRGAMGVTYKAYDTRLDGFVALKVINPGYLNDDVGRERFLREARAAAHLDHPNVAAIFHRGEEGGTYFYAMQFIEGETLDAYVRRRGPLPVALALRLILQAAQGLAAANARGLIHRDIKPANLMLVHLDESGLASGAPGGAGRGNGDGDGEDLLVKVIDFGLAKVVLDDKAGADLSLTGDGPVGTPYYMSPEQIDSSIGEVDARTDIYSLGVTLWYLLTGQPPFVGTQFQVFRQHIGAPPPLAQLPVAVPDNVRGLLGRMMAKTPTDRPANTRELIGLLREQLRGPLAPAAGDMLAAPLVPPAVTPPVIPPWTPPPPAHSGATLADTHQPPSFSPPVASPVALAAFQSVPPPVPPPGVYIPPRPATYSREWKIFGGVLLAALLLGGIPLAYFIPKWNRENHAGNDSPAPTPAAATPTPAASASTSLWKSTPAPAASATPTFTIPPPAAGRVLNVPSQFPTIQAAIDAARPGETVKVAPGTFREKIVFKPGIKLLGSGTNATTVSLPGTSDCLEITHCASGTISGFTFEHTAANPPNDVEYVVWLRGSAVQMKGCRVRNSGSLGVSCEEADTSVIEDCEILGSHSIGLRAEGAGTAPTFRNNHVHNSGWTGITFADGAAGRAENNTSEDNAEFGFILVDKGTAPALTGNTARHNKLSGFTYQKEAAGTASNNTVTDNTEAGVRISDAGTAPALAHNEVSGNGLSGFIVIDGAGGVLDSNNSFDNGGSGVLVKGSGTNPALKNNRLTGNKLNGMYFSDGAGAAAESNTVTGNTQSGVFVTGKNTAPTLRENQVRGNGSDGISVREGAGGLLEGNVCESNDQNGIGVYDAGTSPTLSGNRCEGNKKEATFVEKGATPKRTAKYNGFFK